MEFPQQHAQWCCTISSCTWISDLGSQNLSDCFRLNTFKEQPETASYWRQLGSFFACLCGVFWVLINSLMYSFKTQKKTNTPGKCIIAAFSPRTLITSNHCCFMWCSLPATVRLPWKSCQWVTWSWETCPFILQYLSHCCSGARWDQSMCCWLTGSLLQLLHCHNLLQEQSQTHFIVHSSSTTSQSNHRLSHQHA